MIPLTKGLLDASDHDVWLDVEGAVSETIIGVRAR
jgi:hypothetical protein